MTKENEIFIKASFFIVDKKDYSIHCFINERNKGGWDGYKLSIRFENGKGHYWQLNGFWMANSNIGVMISNEKLCFTKDKFKAVCVLGTCPKCECILFDEFTNVLHDISSCGTKRKKATAENVESA